MTSTWIALALVVMLSLATASALLLVSPSARSVSIIRGGPCNSSSSSRSRSSSSLRSIGRGNVEMMASGEQGRSCSGTTRGELFRDAGAWLKRAGAAGVSAAAIASVASPRPALADEAMASSAVKTIREARKVLDILEPLLQSKDWAAVQEKVSSPPISLLDKAFYNLVNSGVLDAEDKLAVGTIRRYGLAADALIMIGGVGAAVGQEDAKEGLRLLQLGKASLDDIISIGKSNGL